MELQSTYSAVFQKCSRSGLQKSLFNKSPRADSELHRRKICSAIGLLTATSRRNQHVHTRAVGTTVSVVAGVSEEAVSAFVSSPFALVSATASLNIPPKCG